MLELVKQAMGITVTAYDTILTALIKAACLDLGIAGVDLPSSADKADALVQRAIITYCRVNFGSPADYDKLKQSYDEQKAQLTMATGYTDWGEDE